MPEDVANQEFSEEINEQHAGMTPLALACALNKLRSVKVSLAQPVPFVVRATGCKFYGNFVFGENFWKYSGQLLDHYGC